MNSLASPPQIKHITLIICTLDVPGLILTYHVYPKRTEPLLLWFGSKLCKCQDCNWTLHKGPAIFIHSQELSRVFEFLFLFRQQVNISPIDRHKITSCGDSLSVRVSASLAHFLSRKTKSWSPGERRKAPIQCESVGFVGTAKYFLLLDWKFKVN